MRRVDLREVRAVLILAAVACAVGGVFWLAMPNGQPVQRSQATVVSIGPGVQATRDPKPFQAVITLRLDGGTRLTIKRSVDCMRSIQAGDRVPLVGDPNNAGAVTWRIDRTC
ncbi:hypothetical protein ABS767_06070 [Sphingomonas sp. ST-64]|uniref:DUF5666 domain-containing protein n=1 Tax=Sphingomonas plantiphila TaxID=3163295 RepID=A0ABW8YJQ8_9SPHN